MNLKVLFDQLFSSGAETMSNRSSTNRNIESLSNGLSSLISDKGGAALAGGALGLLIGSKSGRKMGGKVLTYGGMAILGTLAYKAYQNYQRQSAKNKDDIPMQHSNALPANDTEAHRKAILIALIAASKSDGHIDERETQLIDQEVTRLTKDPALKQWFDAELKKPLDPKEVASNAASLAMATEMYMASLLATDQQNFMEKAYLDELARQLNLPPALQAELTQQAKSAEVSSRI